MSELVDPTEIEQIVGAPRHPTSHLARSVTAEGVVYILHSRQCKDSGVDLRECEYSVALDEGIDPDTWAGREDDPVAVAIVDGQLVPLTWWQP